VAQENDLMAKLGKPVKVQKTRFVYVPMAVTDNNENIDVDKWVQWHLADEKVVLKESEPKQDKHED
jgi:hypothetical protein